MTAKTIALCTLATAFAFILLWEKVQATRLGYDVGRTRARLRDTRARLSYLSLELERLRAPGRLAKEASQRLGMTPASPETLIFLGNAVARRDPANVRVAKTLTPRKPTLLASAAESAR
jgi:hypothetical protein